MNQNFCHVCKIFNKESTLYLFDLIPSLDRIYNTRSSNMWCVARFGIICTILKTLMGVFHFFYIVQMVTNRAKHHISLQWMWDTIILRTHFFRRFYQTGTSLTWKSEIQPASAFLKIISQTSFDYVLIVFLIFIVRMESNS